MEIEKASQSLPWSENSFRHEINHDDGIFVVAHSGSDILGYGAAWVTVDEIHITTIAVRPENRKAGVAKKIISEILAQGVEKGGTCATLEVRPSNSAAIALYEGFGFASVGNRKNYYPDNKEDAMIMWLYDLDENK